MGPGRIGICLVSETMTWWDATKDSTCPACPYEHDPAQHLFFRPEAKVEREDGLTDPEGDVMDALVDAVGFYFDLPVEHPNEQAEFLSAIHRAQDLLAVRICRRHFPQGWLTYDAGRSDVSDKRRPQASEPSPQEQADDEGAPQGA